MEVSIAGAPWPVDVAAIARQATTRGPQWSIESTDLDVTLLRWTAQQQIAAHVNDEVDVLLIGLDGVGEVQVDATVSQLAAGQVVLIPKGARRALRCQSATWSYLSVHRRRRGLWPAVPAQESLAPPPDEPADR